MISVWEWIEEQNYPTPIAARGGIIGNFLMDIQNWDKSSKSASADRYEDFKEIVNHAKKLSRLLQKYQGEKRQAFNYYSALIPREYDLELKRFLHPDLKARIETRSEILRSIWHQLLPPIEEIISGIARSLDEDDSKLTRDFPRKMAAPILPVMVSELLSAIEIRNAKSGDKPQVARWKRFKPAGARPMRPVPWGVFTVSLSRSCKKGNSLSLLGFGTFEVRSCAARIGRNPKTGEELKIAAAKVPDSSQAPRLKQLSMVDKMDRFSSSPVPAPGYY